MPQRFSGYQRKLDDEYPTPAWVTQVIADYLRPAGVSCVWEPAAGNPAMARELRRLGFAVRATSSDFFDWHTLPSPKIDAIVTNPPYGDDRRGQLAADFIRHALALQPRFVCMLLRVDFDSAKTRQDMFGDCAAFSAKIVLLDRIKWFDGPGSRSPSDNHAWFIHNMDHAGPPKLCYVARAMLTKKSRQT